MLSESPTATVVPPPKVRSASVLVTVIRPALLVRVRDETFDKPAAAPDTVHELGLASDVGGNSAGSV